MSKDSREERIEKIREDTDEYIQEVIDERRERVRKIRKELDSVADEAVRKQTERFEEIEERSKKDPDWFLSDEAKAILEEGKRRSGQSLEREKKAWDDVMNYFDGIRKAADIGFKETIEMFQVHAVASGDRIDKTARNRLLTENDVKGLAGEDVSIDLIEDKITSFAIRELGLDDSKMSEDDKKVLARMVWGREMIVNSIMDQGENEGVNVTRGDVTKNVDFLTFALMENLGFSFEETRNKVSSLSGIMATEEGRKKVVKLVIEKND